jgi:hypothetical protein
MYQRPSEVLVRDLGEELVLLNTKTEQYHSLNDVGRRSYELLTEGQDLDGAAAIMAAEYDAPIETIRSDLAELVPTLVKSGLLGLA